jgi:hypothetical protein
MKRLGQKTVNFPSKTDCKPLEKGVVNWWENIQAGNKSTERTELKKKIKKDVDNYLFIKEKILEDLEKE